MGLLKKKSIIEAKNGAVWVVSVDLQEQIRPEDLLQKKIQKKFLVTNPGGVTGAIKYRGETSIFPVPLFPFTKKK